MALISFAGALLFLGTQTPKPVVDSIDEVALTGNTNNKDILNAVDTAGDLQKKEKVKLLDFKIGAAPPVAEDETAQQTIEM